MCLGKKIGSLNMNHPLTSKGRWLKLQGGLWQVDTPRAVRYLSQAASCEAGGEQLWQTQSHKEGEEEKELSYAADAAQSCCRCSSRK